jgi:hypothetical protein
VLLKFGGLKLEELGGILVSMGSNGSNVFQAHQTSVTLQLKKKVTPFLSGVHCFADKTNPMVVTL